MSSTQRPAQVAPGHHGDPVGELSLGTDAAGQAVCAFCGSRVRQLDILNGSTTDVSPDGPAALRAATRVGSSTEDAGLTPPATPADRVVP